MYSQWCDLDRRRRSGTPRSSRLSPRSALFAVGVLVVRAHSKLYAFPLECPHRGRLLEWQPGDSQFYCPKHKARFSTDGANIGGRRTSALDRYSLRRDGAKVMVSLDRAFSATDLPAERNAAALSV